MTAKKMQVVVLAKTRAVLGGASRTRSGAATVDELAAGGLVARLKDKETSVLVPPEELEVKEVDHTDDVFRDPLAYLVDASDALATAPHKITTVAATSSKVTLTLGTAAPAGDKNVLVVIDAGPNLPPLKFAGKTSLGSSTVAVNVSGVPHGFHLVLASVDGYSSKLDEKAF